MAAVLKKEEQNKQNSRVFTIFSRLFHVWKTGFQILFQEFNTLREAYKSPLACWSLLLVNYSEQSQEAKLTETSLCQLEILFQ